MKAGIMEMADIFIVNKADLPGAQKMAIDIKRIAALRRHRDDDWLPPVLLPSASQPASIAALSDVIDRHQQWLVAGTNRAVLWQARARYRLQRLADAVAALPGAMLESPLEHQLAQVLQGLRSR